MPIAILRPTGAGSLTEWTPLSGTNHGATAAADALYVFAQAAGTRDRYALSDLPAEATAVTSVTAWTTAAGDAVSSTMRLSIRLSGVEAAGAAFAPLDGGFLPFSHDFATAPGALAWTVARVNDLELGPDVVDTTTDFFRVDEVWLAVDYVTSVAAPVRAPKDVEFPDAVAHELDLGSVQSVDFPGTASVVVDMPPSSALDIEIPGRTSPSVEVDDHDEEF